MFKSLRQRLLAIFLLFSAICVGIIVLHSLYNYKRDKIDTADRAIDLIYTSNLLKFHLISDFLALETKNADFYKTGESVYLQKLDSIKQSIERQIVVFEENDEAKIIDLNSTIAEIERNMNLHDSAVNQMIEYIKLQGHSDYGFIGKMRNNAHKLEYIKALDQLEILTLRRHEKDYLLRYENRYIDSVKYTEVRLKNHIVQNKDLNRSELDSCLMFLNSYITYFDSVVILNKEIGIIDNSALYLKVSQIEDEIQNEFADLTSLTFEAEEDIHKNLNYEFLAYSALLILISIIISYYLSNIITKPISLLSQKTNEFVQSGFEDSIEYEITSRDKEIATLVTSFKILKSEIVDLLRNFKQKVEDRTQTINKQNIELIELNATKDKFFSIIAHDLKSPFNSMLGFAKLLDEEYDRYDTEKKKKFIRMINQSLHNTYKLLENLLLWSRSQKENIDFKPEKTNLYLLANETKKLLLPLAADKSIRLVNQVPEKITIYADKDMLTTIIRNLVSNAIKFTPKNGEIIIKAENKQQFTEIEIKDSGVGIAKEVQSKLFDISENTSTRGTENETGTGLGLILCKEFVEKHGGHIWVESEEGKGSNFKFTLPLSISI